MAKTHPRLRTKLLLLRPFVAEDAAPLTEYGGSRAIADGMLDWPHPFSLANARSTIAAQAAAFQGGRAVHFAIERRDDPGLLGAVELTELDSAHRRASLRFWIAEHEWGRGLASEAASEVMRHGFLEMGLHRIEALQLLGNPAAGAVLRKVGMQQEGVLRERIRKGGAYEDAALWACLGADLEPR